MISPLLTTKLYIPRARPELVSRPRLTERLNEGVTRKLTLASKTTPGLTPPQIRRVCGGVL